MKMMEKDLERQLHILNSERCLKKPKEASMIISKITECLNQEQSQFSIGLLIGMILDEDAIFTFIWKTSTTSETTASVTAAFNLLDFLVCNFENCTKPYFPVLFEKSLHLMDTKFAKIKEVALKHIKKLIMADSKNSLELTKLMEKLETYLKEEGKIPGNVADQVFSLLGYIFEKYPEVVKNEEWFLQKLCECLRKEFTVTKNPSSGRQKGAFKGIDGYLVNYTMPEVERERLYEYVKSASRFRPERRLVSKAALRIVKNHWRHFSSRIYDDRFFWRMNMVVWMKQNSEDRFCAFGVLYALYSVIALFVQQKKDPVDEYVKEFCETLNTDGNLFEKIAALMGFKLFILTDCLGEKFKDAYNAVMNFVREHENSYAYLPSCLECVSAFVLKSEIQELTCLERLSVKIINKYPKFENTLNALNSLEKSFYMIGLSNLQTLQGHIERVLYQGLLTTCSAMTQREYEILKESGSTPDEVTCKSYLSLWKYLLDLSNSSNLPIGGSIALKKGVATKVFDSFIKSFLRILSKLNYTIHDTEVENASDVTIFINCVDLFEELIEGNDHIQKWVNIIIHDVIKLSYKNPLVAGFYKIVTKTLRVADCVSDLMDKFLEEVLLKVDLYKGELQLACLRTILASPVRLIQRHLDKVIPAVEVAIQIGRSCFPLLKDVIDELERWNQQLPSDLMESIMQEVLPHFDILFQSQNFRGNDLVDSTIIGKKLKKKVVFNDSELLTLQKNFLIFLGQLDTNKSIHLIQLPDTERHITDKRLIYYVPFLSGKTDLDLDELLPRVIDLAMSCSDRKTRITACELLYSIIMIILGNINQLSVGYSSVFRKTTKASMILACDSDGIICQIFEPLMYQTIHYFSSKKALNFTETNDLIDILMDYVTKPYDPAVREFSAILLKEFIAWTIKQHTLEELKNTPEIIKRILRRIYSLALHPSYNKRQGAAIVFNKIYTILREEEHVLRKYWFELFYYFMESLCMCDGPEDVSEIINAIEHIKRPLVERHGDFNIHGDRITPLEFGGFLLKNLVIWTAEHCSNERKHTRRTAMSIVTILAPLVDGCEKVADIFIQKPDFQITVLKPNYTQDEYTSWLRSQTALFDYVSWLVENNVLNAEAVCKKQPSLITNFAKGISEPQGIEQESIIAFLNLLFVLRERAFYFPINFWDVLQVSTFKPTQLGFDLTHTHSTEELSQILIKLFSYLYHKLPVYYCNYFYDNLEPVIIVPIFGKIIKNRHIERTSMEFLFSMKISQSAGFWDAISVRFSFRGIVQSIFKSLFQKQGENVYAVALEPTCKRYLEELLKLFLSCEDIFECIDDETEIIEEETGKSISKGLYFWLTFKESMYKVLKAKMLINKGEKGLGVLLDAIESNREMAKDVIATWEDVLKTFRNKEILLRIGLAAGVSIGTPGCLKSTPVTDIMSNVDKSHGDIILKLLPYILVPEEECNDALMACLSEIEKSPNFITSILQSLKHTGSLPLLRFILSHATWFKAYKKENIETTLEGFENFTVLHCLKALRLVYSFCFDDLSSSDSVSVIHKLFLQPMMKLFKDDVVFEVVVDNFENLGDILSAVWEDEDLASIKPNIMRKICATNILQIFVLRFTKEKLNSMPIKKRQLLDSIVKKGFFLLKQPNPPKVLNERFRKLMCEMFNMVCCIISARCGEEKFYKLFIFDERGSFLYRAIDESVVYNFGMEFDEVPKRRKHATAIHCAAEDQKKYIQTNTLFTSSLREDVTQFDLTYASIRPQTNQMIELEMDKLNSHECMPVLIATISKIVRDVQHPSGELPCWLKFFLHMLNNKQFSNNHKLFILKALYNVQEYVKPYSKEVLPIVLDCISLFDNYPVNYFLIDLIEMMIKWEAFPVTEKSQRQVTELIVMLIEKSDFLRRDIITNIMEIIKSMIETWKDNLYLQLLSSTVHQRLKNSSAQINSFVGGFDSVAFITLHTAGILLANDIPAWESNCLKEFFKILLNNLREENKTKELYAEVCGMTLAYLKRKNENVDMFEAVVRDVIGEHSVAWLSLVYNVHKHYPKIADSFVFKIFSSAWSANDSLILNKLEMLLSHTSEPEVDRTFLRHADGFLIDVLNSADAAVQELSLQIVFKMLDHFKDDRIVLKEALRLQKSIHTGVRKWVYEIAKKRFDKYPDQCRVVLLRGLSESGELKQDCLDFWKSMKITSALNVFKQMYTPETEDIFLSNAAQLLLHNAGGQYETFIFQNPIIDDRYRKRELLRGTLHSHTNQSVEFSATARNVQYLRPSVPLRFEPTVESVTQENSVSQTIPHNPIKKRFKKQFVKWKKEENILQKQDIVIYGEYSDGNYPDIKIKHAQMLCLLGVLSERDHHIARLLLVSLFNGMVSENASEFFEEVLKTSTSFHPAVIGFVLQVVHKLGLNIDCELISNAATSSNLLSLGALIIEDAITRSDVEEELPKKRRGVKTCEESRWFELSKLYRNLEEYDVLTGIFLDKLAVQDPARNAIKAEAILDYQTASNKYEIILWSGSDSPETEFYTESYFNCIAKLSNWSLLNQCIRSTVDDLDDLWKNYNLLSWFLRSEMMITLGNDKSDFKTIMDGFCKNKAKLNILSANFGEELTVYDWLSGKLQKACYRIDRLCLEFLASWSNIDQWAHNLRVSKLGSLQTLSELNHSVRALAGQTLKPHWESLPTSEDDLAIWDVRLAYRREYLKQKDLTTIGVKANLTLAAAALAQNNLGLAKECMTRASPHLELNPELKDEYNYCFNLGRLAVAKQKLAEANVGIEMYMNIYRGVTKEIQNFMDVEPSVTLFHNFLILGQLVVEVLPVLRSSNVNPSVMKWLREKLNSDDIIKALEKEGLEYLESAKSLAEKLDNSVHSQTDIYERLIKYLLQTDCEREKLARYILKAMSLGSAEARELFGVVVQNEIAFQESESEEVPSWMFIMWINQILAGLNTKQFPLLRSIILRIADDYPNAIRYPYQSIKKTNIPKIKLLEKRLSKILCDTLHDEFVISLSYLAPPDVILRRYLENALEGNVREVLKELQKVMFSPDRGKFRGEVFKYWDKFKLPLENAMKAKTVEEVKSKIEKMLSNIPKLPSKRVSLESYSPWLYNFHSIKTTGTLELPGQYGNKQPVRNPVTITSFRSDILIFDTKCQPIRITILGNDAKEHGYLIKFGEDLRQDERVQQLFGHFNHRLLQSKQTKRYHIKTYKIIPLNNHQGLIQWVHNHVSLYDMMRNALKDPNQIAVSQNAHLARMASTSPINAHLMAYDKLKRETCITNFNARVNDFPKDLLKQSFLGLSTSPEQFVYLRGNFATSHAVMSITHWLIGIGDRHLQNILVSTKTGYTLGIDFGYAFGFATHLTPPELIPFRLTPQILNLMQPLKESGWIKQTMIHSLRVFRSEQFGLRAILEVFVREPVIDWLKQAKKSGRYKADEAWDPKERVAIVEKKLKDVNPVSVIEADLKLGHSLSGYLEKYVEVLKGVKQENIRARVGADGLSEEDQVECLIDLATDPHVLGKTYVGWNPWL